MKSKKYSTEHAPRAHASQIGAEGNTNRSQAIFIAYFLLLSGTVLSAGCDSGGGTGNIDPSDTLKVELDTVPEVLVEGSSIELTVREDGAYKFGVWRYSRGGGNEWLVSFLGAAGLVVATNDVQPRASTGYLWNTDLDLGRFALTDIPGEESGIFLLDRSLDKYEITNWPENLNAPVNADGSHRLYGDNMAWLSIEGTMAGSGTIDEELKDVRVGSSVFIVEDSEYRNVIFFRYDIMNIGDDVIPEVFVGYFSDTDLNNRLTYGLKCSEGGVGPANNQSAYDMSRDLVYTYFKPVAADGDLDPVCYGISTGFAFLDLSTDNASTGTFSSRIVTKSPFAPYFPSFSDALIDTPARVIFAMQGLDPDGNAMMDPTTNQPTRFAFTGDPLTETGWIDERNDLRQFISKPVFSLAAGETKSLMLVWVVEQGADYTEAIARVKAKFDEVRQKTALWDY